MNLKTPQQLQEDGARRLHIPVLLDAVLNVLTPQKGESYLDLTAGYGGHAGQVIAVTGEPGRATLVDRDENAIKELEPFREAGVRILKSDFAAAARHLKEAGEQFDMVLIDLGVSSPQLDNAERGFSFMAEGPLDMRMDPSTGHTAADYINRVQRDELIKVLREYGEEPKAVKIANAIVDNRPFTTTAQLAALIEKVYVVRGKTHPATRTFQALRIAVNDELGQLNETLELLPDLLNPGGRAAIISFHSLEDRLVKRFFKEEADAGYEARLQILTKQPISGATEDVHNPRARSAKLRAAVKINT